jgi:hypothetical protein
MLTAESRAALVAEFDLFRGAETLRPLLALTSRDFMPPILAAGFSKDEARAEERPVGPKGRAGSTPTLGTNLGS